MKRLFYHVLPLLMILIILSPRQALSTTDREQEIREAVTAYVVKRTANSGWEARIRRISTPDKLTFPAGSVDYEINAPQQWEGWGYVNMAVIVRQNDRVIRNIPVRVEVETLADTVVTLHQIEQGIAITTADIILQKREITQSSFNAARTMDTVVGKKASTTIRANQPVRVDQVEKIPLVKSGQMVTIIAESGGMKISVSGKARSSGAEGDIVRVQNLTSYKEIPARVIDASTVQIAF